MRKVLPIILVICLAAVVVVLSARRQAATETAQGIYSGTIEAEESRVGSTVGGRVTQTLVAEGDMVDKGQLIVVLQPDQLTENLKAAVAAEETAANRLHDLEAGPRAQEIERARAAVRESEAVLEKLKNGSRKEDIEAAVAALNQAREKLALINAGAREEEIAHAKANLDIATADRKFALIRWSTSLGRVGARELSSGSTCT